MGATLPGGGNQLHLTTLDDEQESIYIANILKTTSFNQIRESASQLNNRFPHISILHLIPKQ